MAERKMRERRREEARFFLIERRDRGSIWVYGSILVAVGLSLVARWLVLG